ncbi:uncharacterized protein Dvir_GJ23814 [Drosophila virilis]|uniref:Uncharacterized protein n=2 Tax=Drosophila virilis TaxID=7244 RepID=B4LXW7_DROVI|nr:uncharacterized protein LOC6630657 [Drosophila virilis]EDW66833.2 uncharacterized protein Dvir_GJ23814 [Drosophila virilis]
MRCGLWIQLLGQLAFALVVFGEPNRTELNHVVERVFSRQKRFVLFPKGSNLKFTGSISKGLLSRFPKGVAMNIEQACYYPVPSSREDVYPKRFRPRTTTTPEPKTTTEPTYVWIAGTDWRYKATPVKKPKPLRLHQRIDYRPQMPYYADPAKWKQWSKYGERFENWTPARPYYEKYKQPGKWSKWTTAAPKWNNYGKRWYRSVKSQQDESPVEEDPYDPETAPYEAVTYPDLEHFTNWQQYHGHRDRRQLFEQFGGFSKLLGIDTKACILRAICDSKRLLLPPGYSMLQDIVRLIFTLPTISGVEDEYSRMMRMNAEDCDRQFRDQCKLNLLGVLLDGKWGH